jgi:arginase
MRIDLVTVPYRYDEYGEGMGAGPDALLGAGLPDRLRASGIEVHGLQEARLDAAEREAGRTAVNIGRLGADTARLVADARRGGGGVLVLAGDDTAAIGVVSGLQQVDGAGAALGIVWVDAHGDFNTPETSFSGILAGMPVAILAGLAGPLWREAAELAAPVATDRIVLAGTRDLDEKETELLRSTEVRVLHTGDLRAEGRFAGVIDWLAGRCALLYLHIDLDVLDPRFVPSASTPAADGLTIEELVATLATVLRTGKVAAVTLSSLNPGAGTRGERSVASAMKTLENALPTWTVSPEVPDLTPAE